MYTLILITALLPTDYRTGGNLSSSHVPGFSTKQACVNAGNSLVIPSSRYSDSKIIFTCVKMDV